MPSPFEKFASKAWPFWYEGQMIVSEICGGVPADPKVAESWIKTKLKDTRSDAEVRKVIEETKAQILETNQVAGRADAEGNLLATVATAAELSDEELTQKAVDKVVHDFTGLNMFKRTPEGLLYVEGRQLKAAILEAASVAANAGKITTKGWGKPDNASYKKGAKSWFPEHVFVTDKILTLWRMDGEPVTEPDKVNQKFIHTHRGDALGYEEAVLDAVISFTVKTDVEIREEEWAMIWLTGQDQGLGASRSQGFGTYEVTEWTRRK